MTPPPRSTSRPATSPISISSSAAGGGEVRPRRVARQRADRPLLEGFRTDAVVGLAVSDDGTSFTSPAAPAPATSARVGRSRGGITRSERHGRGSSADLARRPQTRGSGARDLCSLWLVDLRRGVVSRLTLDEDSHDPVWRADGRAVALLPRHPRGRDLVEQAIDGVKRGCCSPRRHTAVSSRVVGGRSQPAVRRGPRAQRRRSWRPFGCRREGVAAVGDSYLEIGGVLSPTAAGSPIHRMRAAARRSTRASSGRDDEDPGLRHGRARSLVVTDGRELFYASGRRMMAASFATGVEPVVGVPRELFRALQLGRTANYDISPDGQRFVMVEPVGEGPRPAKCGWSSTGSPRCWPGSVRGGGGSSPRGRAARPGWRRPGSPCGG